MNGRTGTVSVLAALCLCWLATPSSSGTTPGFPAESEGDLTFYADRCAFRRDSLEAWQEIYYQIPFSELTYVKSEEGFAAGLETTVWVVRSSGDTLLKDSWAARSTIRSYEEAQRGDAVILNQFAVPVRRETYLFGLQIRDRNSGLQGRIVRLLQPPENLWTKGLALSDIQLSTSLTPDTTTSVFSKSGLRVVPTPMRTFGARIPIVYAYVEVYGLALDPAGKENSYRADYAILDSSGVLIRSLPTKEGKKQSGTTVETGGVSVLTLHPGVYRLRMTITDERSKTTATGEAPFSIERPPEVKLASGAPASAPALEQHYRDIELIATQAELKLFRSLDEPGKEKFLIDFWQKRDPNPATAENEFLREISRRVRYTDDHYGAGRRIGSKSDQGRIYIKYGPPDEIERHPADLEYPANEIWLYYSKGGQQFAFSDRDGTGQMRLVYSSVREEPTDPSWEKYVSPSSLIKQRR